jgi:hypothetical protein
MEIPTMLSRRSSIGARCAALLLPAAALAPAAGLSAQGRDAAPDSGAFVTRLGADTLVVERFVRTPRRFEAEVIVRVPTTRRVRYDVQFGPDGELARMETVTTDPRAGTAARRELLVREGDSLRVTASAGDSMRVAHVAAERAALPFIDMVHWPYELALVRARGAGTTAWEQPLLTGRRVSRFPIAAVGTDSVTITHPSRGTMRARVDATGHLLGLDAGATTRKLVVERRPWISLDGLAERWSALDAAGKSLGALSGRGEESETVAGASLTVDYGTPAKRGRAIWGSLVPYGQVWRTGANQATHFSTDRDLVLGRGPDTLVVPAGRYTLFSIPAEDGGVLIVSKQTGQAGTAYDPAHDLGRIPMAVRALDAPIELFTIDVAPAGTAGGEIRLRWDRGERFVPFRVSAGGRP